MKAAHVTLKLSPTIKHALKINSCVTLPPILRPGKINNTSHLDKDDDKIFTNRIYKHSNISLTTFLLRSNCFSSSSIRGNRGGFRFSFALRIFCFRLPIIDLAGTAFHSSQNVIKDDVTKIMPGMKTVVK